MSGLLHVRIKFSVAFTLAQLGAMHFWHLQKTKKKLTLPPHPNASTLSHLHFVALFYYNPKASKKGHELLLTEKLTHSVSPLLYLLKRSDCFQGLYYSNVGLEWVNKNENWKRKAVLLWNVPFLLVVFQSFAKQTSQNLIEILLSQIEW